MVYSNYPPPPSEILPTMDDLPSEDPQDLDLPDECHPRPPSETLPTMDDLPSEDPKEPGLPDEFHDFQPKLLRETCQSPVYPAQDMFMGADLNLYYDVRHTRWYKRPDWFLVLGVPRASNQTDLRRSYVIWQEGVSPFLVIELLSPGTEADDLGQTLREVNQPPTKWQVYEQILRVPYYGLFDRYTNTFRLFRLFGPHYQEIHLTERQFWFEELKLGLGIWQGQYQGTEGLWLRWYQANGAWVPTPEERAEQESQRAEQASQRANQEHQRAEQERQRAEQASQRAEQESQRAEQESQRAERLAAQLRALGVDPD